jgi:hypothetical protein
LYCFLCLAIVRTPGAYWLRWASGKSGQLQTSTNKSNLAAYSSFKALTEQQQELLVKAITVIDGAPDIARAHEDLARELRFSAPTDHVGSFLERLEGWWFGRTVRALHDDSARTILAKEVDDTISLLREQFKTDTREAHEHVARLRSVELFGAATPAAHCPLCATLLQAQVPAIEDLVRSVKVTSSQLESVAASAPHMQGLINRLEREVDEVKQQLAENREAIDAVEASREKLTALRDHASRRAHVLGRVSLYIESVRVTDDAGSLRKSVQEASDRVAELQQQLSGDVVAERLQSIGSVLSTRMTEWARALQLEHAEKPHRIDFGRLTVVADAPDGPLPMERMGSAETWVSCHLIAHLALHEWFAERARPVPRFLFLDQPSEVYFPADKDVGNGAFADVKDEDREAVKRMFKLLFEIAETIGVQVVLTDHADLAESWFQDAVVQRWRGNEKLVPIDW